MYNDFFQSKRNQNKMNKDLHENEMGIQKIDFYKGFHWEIKQLYTVQFSGMCQYFR